jgi:hypothetical protein
MDFTNLKSVTVRDSKRITKIKTKGISVKYELNILEPGGLD